MARPSHGSFALAGRIIVGRGGFGGVGAVQWACASLIIAGLGAALMASSACSLAEKVSADQCTVDADCARIGAAGASCVNNVCTSEGGASASSAWSCLGHVPDETQVAPTPVTLTMPFLNVVDNQPIAGVVVHACAKLDLDCKSPVTADYTSNADGIVSFPITAGFNGYLKTTWAPAPTTLVFINPPQVNSVPLQATDLISTFDFTVITEETTDGGKVDTSLGEIFAGVLDCNLHDAAGVSLTIDSNGPTTKLAYVIGGLPQLNATQTDASGEFVVINVPSGSFTLTATLVATGQRIGIATGFARAGEYSFMTVAPSP